MGQKRPRCHEKVFEKLQAINEDLLVTMVDTPEGEDINSLIQGHDLKVLQQLISERSAINKISGKKKMRDRLTR